MSISTEHKDFPPSLRKAVRELPPPINKIPPEGNLLRCRHGVYDPDEKGRAYGCQLCNPPKPIDADARKVAKKFSMPGCGDCLNISDRPHANVREPGACPKCGSFIHSTANSNATGNWHCEDCGTVFAPPRKQRVTFVEAAD